MGSVKEMEMANDNLATALSKGSNGAIQAPPTSNAPGANSPLAEAYRMAKVFANSQFVPKHMQGKPDDCFIAIITADYLRENALMVMQNIVVVQGTAGWKATFVIARANAHGPFEGPIEFRTDGAGAKLGVTAYATVRATKRVVEKRVDLVMAEAAGWTANKKYKEIPEQMLSYRAACFLVRLYCPEVLLGMHTEDELVDTHVARGGRFPVEMVANATTAIDVLNSDAPALPAAPESRDPSPEERAELERLDRGEG